MENDMYKCLMEPSIKIRTTGSRTEKPGTKLRFNRNWAGIKSPAIQSRLFFYIHDRWLTGEVAFIRHLTKRIPKCRLCGAHIDSKKHLILECQRNNLERQNIKNKIKQKYGTNETAQLLFTNGINDKNLYNDLTNFINSVMKTICDYK